MPTTEFDNLEIPEFLKISPADRKAAWVGVPLTVPGADPVRVGEKKVAVDGEAERKALIKRNRDITRRALEKEHKQFMSIPKSMRRWNTTYCRWEADPVLKRLAELRAKAGKSAAIVIAPKADAKPKSPSKKLPVCERVHRFVLAIRGSLGAKVANLNDTELADNLELWRLTSPERAVAKAERVYA